MAEVFRNKGNKSTFLKEKILKHPTIVLLSLACAGLAAIATAIGNIEKISRYIFRPLPEISDVTKNLGSLNIQSRIKGAIDAGRLGNASPDILDIAVQILSATIQKRSTDPVTQMPRDIQTALESISTLLIAAERRSLKTVFPDFEGMNYSFADMHGLYLRGVTIRNSSLEDVNLEGANLTGAKLENVSLSRARLQSAILNSAEIYSTCLENADFTNATLFATSLESSDLNGAIFAKATIDRSKFANSRLANASFKEAVLRNTDFGSALNLTNAQLKSAKQLENIIWPEEQNRVSRLSTCRE